MTWSKSNLLNIVATVLFPAVGVGLAFMVKETTRRGDRLGTIILSGATAGSFFLGASYGIAAWTGRFEVGVSGTLFIIGMLSYALIFIVLGRRSWLLVVRIASDSITFESERERLRLKPVVYLTRHKKRWRIAAIGEVPQNNTDGTVVYLFTDNLPTNAGLSLEQCLETLLWYALRQLDVKQPQPVLSRPRVTFYGLGTISATLNGNTEHLLRNACRNATQSRWCEFNA